VERSNPFRRDFHLGLQRRHVKGESTLCGTVDVALIAWCMIVISHPNHRLEYASELKWSGSFYDFQVGKRFL
jgi:hypothetical protein